MRYFLLVTFVVAGSVPLLPQEREVPKDSVLVAIQGCAKGRTFIVSARSEHAPGSLEIAPGRRFRLNGPKSILNEIKKREAMMVEVTGLVRKSQLAGPGGVSIAGGRVRIGGALPRSNDPTRELPYNEAVIDVEAWRGLAEPCAAR